jgi:hypothetical protein
MGERLGIQWLEKRPSASGGDRTKAVWTGSCVDAQKKSFHRWRAGRSLEIQYSQAAVGRLISDFLFCYVLSSQRIQQNVHFSTYFSISVFLVTSQLE